MSVSVLILTLNEEANLPRCLAALAWCDDLVVVDSFSTDRTVEIAKGAGARVVQRQFDNFAEQRNFALDLIDFKHEWVLHLDADEVCTNSLRDEIRRRITDDRYDAYRLPAKTIFLGKWLRFAGMYPTYQVRLGRHRALRFRQSGHGQQEDMDPLRVGTLDQPYLHYSFSKGLESWFDKVNQYTSQEAREALSVNGKAQETYGLRFWLDPVGRRRALKRLSYRVPYRPGLRFFYMYLIRLGFLDGYAGFQYCRMLATYEFMIDVKMQEYRRHASAEDSSGAFRRRLSRLAGCSVANVEQNEPVIH